MLRVLILHEDRRGPGKGGGAESLLRDQTQALRDRGHTVEWWQSDEPIAEQVAVYRPDICHIMTIHNFIGLRPAEWLQTRGIPHVWALMDYWPFCGGRMLLRTNDDPCSAVEGICDKGCHWGPAPEIYREIVNRSPVIALNRYTADIYRRHGLRVDYIFPLGIDTEMFAPDHSKREGVRIMTSSAWAAWPTKGMHILKKALRKAGVNAKLVTGQPREKVRDELQKSAIFVFPSIYQETWGLCLTEAMACGCACIASDVAGPRQQITPGVDGILVPPRNATTLAKAIRDLLDNPEKRERLGRSARFTAERKFTLADMGKRLEAIYKDAIKRATNG